MQVLGALAGFGLVVFLVGAGGGSSVSSDEAKALVAKHGALLLDVRTTEEFTEGHLEGATNIPVQDLEAKLGSFPAPKDQNIVVYCRSGSRSARAAELLKKAGYTRVFDLGAMSNWK